MSRLLNFSIPSLYALNCQRSLPHQNSRHLRHRPQNQQPLRLQHGRLYNLHRICHLALRGCARDNFGGQKNLGVKVGTVT